MNRTGLVWFRNDLRTLDNTSLWKAVSENNKVIAVFCFDPRLFNQNQYGFRKTEKYRAKFLIESVVELQENLSKLNISLLIYHAEPESIFKSIIKNNNVHKVYLQNEWTRDEVSVLNALKNIVHNEGVEWVESYDQFLFHPDDIPFDIKQLPRVFTVFRKQLEKLAVIRKEVFVSPLPLKNKIENNTSVPSLFDLGLQEFDIDSRTAFPFKGGENQGMKRIKEYFWKTRNLSRYKKTRNGLVGEMYSSKLSPWLANGSISARTIYYNIRKYEQEIEKNQSTYWLVFELIWRDFFKYVSLKHGKDLFRKEGILNKNYSWSLDIQSINRWIQGETNEPFVNANMIELNNTGWMSNRGRQNVASYFAKKLKLDWRIGAAYFESLLMDYDVHSNYGNWQYVAGVGNDPRDRKFNVKLQSERYDPQQKFQGIWLQPTLF